MVAVLEPVVPTRVAGRSIYPAFVMAVLEVGAMVIVARPGMARAVVPRLVPARARRIVLELGWPRLRSEIPARRMPMMHERRGVMQDDAKIQRGHHIRNRDGPVGRCRGRQHGDGAKRDGEKKMSVHGVVSHECS